VLAGLFVFTLSVFVPVNVPLPRHDVDASWVVTLHWAHVHGIDFGHDLDFTYGPWGFALQPYLPSTFELVVAVWSLLAAAFFAAAMALARRLEGERWAAALWMLAVIGVTGASDGALDTRMTAMTVLLLVLHFYTDDRSWTASKIALAAAMALTGLIKFSMALTALPVLAAISAEQLWRRRVPSMLLVYVVAYLGLWLAAGQHLSSLWPYWVHSWDIASGYSEGESLTLPTEATDVTLFLLDAGLLLTMVALIHPWRASRPGRRRQGVIDEPTTPGGRGGTRPSRSRSLVGAAALTWVLFTVFKSGYVRHDGRHEIIAWATAAMMAVVLAGAVWLRLDHHVARGFVILTSLLTLMLTWNSFHRFDESEGAGYLVQTVAQLPARVATAAQWALGGKRRNQRYEEVRQGLCVWPAPQVEGPVDTYSYGQAALLAQGLEYRPRPVFQSYVAYTAALEQMNAESLRGPRAPTTILFNVEPIDGRFPSQEDALSWPQLLSGYDVQDVRGVHLVLRRAAPDRGFTLTPIERVAVPMGQWLAVPPSDDPIWVQVETQITPLGRLLRAAYKRPYLALGVKMRAGGDHPFRLVPEIAKGGFLLSPLISDRMQFATLYSPHWKQELADAQVDAITVGTESGATGIGYHEQCTVTFSRLVFGHVDVSAVPGMSQYRGFLRLLAQMTVARADTPPQFTSEEDGKFILLAPAKCQLMFPAPAGAKDFCFGFGMLRQSYQMREKTDGVEFRVYTVDQIQGRQVGGDLAWSQKLDPANVREDRDRRQVEIHLPSSPATLGVLLETDPGPEHRQSLSYWTDLEFR